MIYKTFDEFGRSIFVTAGFMKQGYDGNAIEYFIKEIGSLLPRVSSWGGEIFEDSYIRTGFEAMYNLGCTYIADFYYYFGDTGQYAVVLLGIWLGFIDNTVDKWIQQKRYVAIAVAIPGIINVINGVRATASLGLKMFLYSFAIFMVIQGFYRKGKAQLP